MSKINGSLHLIGIKAENAFTETSKGVINIVLADNKELPTVLFLCHKFPENEKVEDTNALIETMITKSHKYVDIEKLPYELRKQVELFIKKNVKPQEF